MIERTYAEIKPDAVALGLILPIQERILGAGLEIVRRDIKTYSRKEALEFAAEHKGQWWHDPLVELKIAGPTCRMILQGESAISVWRAVIGSTKPAMAAPGTIRKMFAQPGEPEWYNKVHGSDSPESAKREITANFGAEYVEVE